MHPPIKLNDIADTPGCFLVSFAARLLASLPGRLFCYNAVASAAITVILPGFTICKSTSFVGDYVSAKRPLSLLDICPPELVQNLDQNWPTGRFHFDGLSHIIGMAPAHSPFDHIGALHCGIGRCEH